MEANAIEFSCRSKDGRPAARIDWAITADAQGRNIITYITADNNLSSLVHPHHHQTRGFFNLKNKQKAFNFFLVREHLSSSALNVRNYASKIIETIDTNDEGFSTITSNLT